MRQRGPVIDAGIAWPRCEPECDRQLTARVEEQSTSAEREPRGALAAVATGENALRSRRDACSAGKGATARQRRGPQRATALGQREPRDQRRPRVPAPKNERGVRGPVRIRLAAGSDDRSVAEAVAGPRPVEEREAIVPTAAARGSRLDRRRVSRRRGASRGRFFVSAAIRRTGRGSHAGDKGERSRFAGEAVQQGGRAKRDSIRARSVAGPLVIDAWSRISAEQEVPHTGSLEVTSRRSWRTSRICWTPRLIEAGYHLGAHVIRPAADHPVFGYQLCPVAGCMAAVVAGTLCYGCR
jgi:hypothetical protein